MNPFVMMMSVFVLVATCIAAEPASSENLRKRIAEEFRWIREEAVVVTASQKAQKISEAPATIISISQEEITAYGWRDLKDIFRALPGFDLSYNVQGEMKTQVTMRGVTGNQKILILQDGQKYSSASGERFLYGNNIPLNIYKRIEIIYGPASSMYGADAYSGVINLITKDGADYNGTQFIGGYVSTGAYTASVSSGKKISNDADVVLSARIYHGTDDLFHDDYDEYSAIHSYQGKLAAYSNEYPVENWNLFFKLRYKKFTLGFDWQHEYESNAGVSLPNRYAYVDEFVWGQDLRHAYIEHESYSDDRIKIKTTISAGDYELNSDSNYFIAQKDSKGNISDGYPAYKYAYSSYLKGSVQADWKITEKLSTITGVSYEYVSSFPKTRNLATPFNTDRNRQVDMRDFVDSKGYTFGILGFSEPSFGERNFDTVGAFTEAEYKLSDKIRLNAGIRYDHNSIYGSTINPRCGMIVYPINDLTVKFLYGTAFIQPANFFRYENFANPALIHIPNETLEPETLKNYSIDIAYIFGKGFSIETSLFLNRMEDIIRAVAAPAQAGNYPYFNPYRAAGDPGYVEYNGNQGDIESKGGEITLKHRIDKFSNSLSYSYLSGDDNGYDIPGVSEHKLTLNSMYSSEKWTAGFTLRYYSDVSTDKNNYRYGLASRGGDESYAFDGALIAYLNLIYRLDKHLAVNFSVDNVFDTEHYGGVPSDGSPVVVPRTPQPLRVMYLGLSYSF